MSLAILIMSATIVSGIANLYCNELDSDIKFVIESEKLEFPAHKLVIGLGSDVLHHMVYGNGTTVGTSTIVVPTFSSNDFLVVLKYLYTGDIKWNLDSCTGVLEVGKYFGLTDLENSFNGFLADTINLESALDIFGRHFHTNDIISRTAMKIIQLKLRTYVEPNFKFFDLPTEALVQILQLDELGISERDLFDRMIAWAKFKGYGFVSPVLGQLVNLIRFANMADLDEEIGEEFTGFITSRWYIKVIQIARDEDVEGSIGPDCTEIIMIRSTRTIRLHGLSTITLEPIFVEKNNQFEMIPSCRSKVFKENFVDVMFENPITIPQNTSIKLKVPASSKRYQFEEDVNDDSNFTIQSVQNGKSVDHHSIVAVFVSKSKI